MNNTVIVNRHPMYRALIKKKIVYIAWAVPETGVRLPDKNSAVFEDGEGRNVCTG